MTKLRPRSKVPTIAKAVGRIRKRGVLLVFPIHNREEPRSLWSEFFPGTELVWDWNEGGDMRVAEMWQLMKLLSDSSEVVYSKWYQGSGNFLLAGAVPVNAGRAAPDLRSFVVDFPTQPKHCSRFSRTIRRFQRRS